MEIYKNRPFFSIVIACHNCSNTIERLLDSILDQEIDQNDMEIIISDDRSTDDTIEKVKKYEDRMNIVYTRVPDGLAHSPGNTKQVGLDAATGEWLIFSDHDDAFEPQTLHLVKQYLIDNKITYHMRFGFTLWSEDNSYLIDMYPGDSDRRGDWIHGHLYNTDWVKNNNIHFPKDILGEDIYFNSCARAQLLVENNGDYSRDFYQGNSHNLYIYRWIDYKKSFSRSIGEDFAEIYFKDTVHTLDPFIEWYKRYPQYAEAYYFFMVNGVINQYFLIQGDLFKKRFNYRKDNFIFLANYIQYFLKLFKSSLDELNEYVYRYPLFFNGIRSLEVGGIGAQAVEMYSFRGFIELIKKVPYDDRQFSF